MIGIWKQYSKEVGVVLPPGGAMRMDMNWKPHSAQMYLWMGTN